MDQTFNIEKLLKGSNAPKLCTQVALHGTTERILPRFLVYQRGFGWYELRDDQQLGGHVDVEQHQLQSLACHAS